MEYQEVKDNIAGSEFFRNFVISSILQENLYSEIQNLTINDELNTYINKYLGGQPNEE